MTLTVKKSRSISIQNKDFRYQISTSKVDEDWNFSLNLTIQRWNPPRGVLEVKGLITRDYWLDISDGKKWNIGDYPVLLPMHINRIIKVGMESGWDTLSQGKSFKLDTNNGAVFKT